jgi:hypothetical protein
MFYGIRRITYRHDIRGELTDRRLRVGKVAFSYLGLRAYSPAGVHWGISPSNGRWEAVSYEDFEALLVNDRNALSRAVACRYRCAYRLADRASTRPIASGRV